MDAVEFEWHYCVICGHKWEVPRPSAPNPWGRREWQVARCPECGFEATGSVETERLVARTDGAFSQLRRVPRRRSLIKRRLLGY